MTPYDLFRLYAALHPATEPTRYGLLLAQAAPGGALANVMVTSSKAEPGEVLCGVHTQQWFPFAELGARMLRDLDARLVKDAALLRTTPGTMYL